MYLMHHNTTPAKRDDGHPTFFTEETERTAYIKQKQKIT